MHSLSQILQKMLHRNTQMDFTIDTAMKTCSKKAYLKINKNIRHNNLLITASPTKGSFCSEMPSQSNHQCRVQINGSTNSKSI